MLLHNYGVLTSIGINRSGDNYRPLVNYKWSTLAPSDDYVTDGVELVTNGDFSDGLNGWYGADSRGTVEQVNGRARVNNDEDDGYPSIAQNIYFAVGMYEITADILIGTSTGAKIRYLGETTIYSTKLVADGSVSIIVDVPNAQRSSIMLYNHESGNTGSYVEFDNISVKRVLQEPQSRYLRDSGANPKYPAKLAFGRGASFNGVDQVVDITNITDVAEGDMTFLVNFTADSFVDKRIHDRIDTNSSGYAHRHFLLELKDDDGDGLYIYLDGWVKVCELTVNKNYSLSTVYRNTEETIDFYINGIFVKSLGFKYSFTPKTSEVLGASHLKDTRFFNSILSNAILLNQALTPSQIEYQHKNPEKFLHHTKSTDVNGLSTWTAKTELVGFDVSNVAAHFPMCETDGYSRNMIGYSEGVELFDTASNSSGDTTTITLSDTTYNIIVTGDTGNNIYPYVKPASSSALSDGTLYLHTFEVTVLSGTALVNKIVTGLSSNTTVLAESISSGNTFKMEIVNTYRENIPYIAFDGTAEFNFEANVTMSIKQLTNTNEIQNFTQAVRDDAIGLKKGLQTCYTTRDLLGVPTDSDFNSLVMNNEVNPMKIPMTDTELNEANGGYWQIEMVIEREFSYSFCYLIDTLNADTGVKLFVDGTDNRIALKLYENTTYTQVTDTTIDENPHHIVFSVTPTQITMTVDGVDGTPVDHSFVPSGLSFADSVQKTFKGKLPLFNIHTEVKNPQELYVKAIEDGAFGDVKAKGMIDMTMKYESTSGDGTRLLEDKGVINE